MMNHNDFPKMTEEFDRSVRRALDSLPERESKPYAVSQQRKSSVPDWLPRCASAEPHLPRMHRAGSRCCFRMAETRISKDMCRRRTTPS